MRRVLLLPTILLTLLGCDSQESIKVMVPVETETRGLAPAQNAQGWRVTVTGFRMALRDLQFTIRGEMHARLLRRLGALVLPAAQAHPGHYAGGEVTGEMPGRFLVDFVRGGRLGTAILIVGNYHGANFTFRRADQADGLPPGDPLLGHSAHLEGTADKDGRRVAFRARLDVDDGAQLVGARCDLEVTEATRRPLALQAQNHEPVRMQTLFDGLDFGAYDPDGDGQVDIAPGQQAHNILRRALQVHDFYNIIPH